MPASGAGLPKRCCERRQKLPGKPAVPSLGTGRGTARQAAKDSTALQQSQREILNAAGWYLHSPTES